MGFESRVGSVSPMCRWFWMYEEGYLADFPGIFLCDRSARRPQ